MAILAGVVPKDAVNWVRQHYHQKSIDTREQEKWVLWFAEEAERRGSGRGKRMC